MSPCCWGVHSLPHELERDMELEGTDGCRKLTTGKKQIDGDGFTRHPRGLHMCLAFQM